MKLSVVVPLYNKAEFLPHFFDNIINQGISYTDFELILVNDGSSDNTEDLCDKFIISHPNLKIKYIYQRNSGVSAARNKGICMAKGEFIHFMDCDDLLMPKSYEFLINNFVCNSVDFIGFGLNWFDLRSKAMKIPTLANSKYCLDSITLSGVDCIEQVIWPSTCVLALYRTSFLNKHNIRFPNGVPIGEDVWFNYDFFKKNPNCIFTQNKHYIYCFRTGSVMSSTLNEGEKWLSSYEKFLSHLLTESKGNSSVRKVVDHHLKNLMRKLLRMNVSHKVFSAAAQQYIEIGLIPIRQKSLENRVYNTLFFIPTFYSVIQKVCRALTFATSLVAKIITPPINNI